MSARYPCIDNLKAIGIVLVVLGHAPGMAGAAHTLIFGFHVPLFFFASGFLAGARERDAGMQLRALLRRFVLPYAGFFLLSWLYWLPTHELGNAAAQYAALPWWDPLVDFALGQGSYVNPTLWFFPCIALTALLHWLARRWLAGVPLLLVCVAVAAGVVLLWPGGQMLPWRLDAAAVALGFHAVGHFCRERGLFGLAQWPAVALWPWALLLLAAYAALALGNPGIDLAEMRFGASPVLFLPVALLGIAACLLASLCFAGNRLTRWLAANTLTIFPLHWLMFRVFTGVGIVIFALPRDFKDQSWLIGVGYALLALLLCWPAANLVRRAMTWRNEHELADRPRGAAVPPLGRRDGGRGA
jgi:acyltransferase